MNTIGKILVILNFIFAVTVGAFLVIDFATRSNWKAAYDSLNRELQSTVRSREAGSEVASGVVNDLKQARAEVETLKQKLADQEANFEVEKVKFGSQITDAQMKAKDADLSLQRALSDVNRLTIAAKDLNKVIKDREEFIVTLQTDVKKYRNEALAQEENARAAQARNEQLRNELEETTRKLAQKETGNTPGVGPRVGSELNPPAGQVTGKVEKVYPSDNTLVKLSVGSDQGVRQGNTLEVFRRRPEAKYVGVVRITDTYPNYSVGRMVVPPGAIARTQVREGDEVASRLGR
jgi:hypothetical protein